MAKHPRWTVRSEYGPRREALEVTIEVDAPDAETAMSEARRLLGSLAGYRTASVLQKGSWWR